MNIGQVAEQSGVRAKTIRYYEDIGMIVPQRRHNGYRSFSEANLHLLRFLRLARDLGFDLKECRDLLALWQERGETALDIQAAAGRQVADIDRRVAGLRRLQGSLRDLMAGSARGERPGHPIVEDR